MQLLDTSLQIHKILFALIVNVNSYLWDQHFSVIKKNQVNTYTQFMAPVVKVHRKTVVKSEDKMKLVDHFNSLLHW